VTRICDNFARNVAIFFRRRSQPFEPAVHWVFAADIGATYEELRSLGARIVEPLEKNLGVCASSQWKTLMATASTSTVTEKALYNATAAGNEAEVRRMFVTRAARRGLAKAVLVGLEARAHRLGYAVLKLETGYKQTRARASQHP
jgi:hypothetical protein